MSKGTAANSNSRMKKLPVGVSDFKDMILGNYYYLDKSLFIKEVIDKGDKILLIPRPRRFGKTLNLSMLKYFYDCCPNPNAIPGKVGSDKEEARNSNEKLFDSLAIYKAGEEYRDIMGKYPVIFLTFKNVKELDWQTTYRKIKKLIAKEYTKHYYLLDSDVLILPEKKYFQDIIKLKGEVEDYENSLEMLLIFLTRYYGQRAVILIDEYDAPIHAGFKCGYYDDIISFTRNFLCGGLKDTDEYLEKSVITGILRIAKESIFSGLNNPGVYTLLREDFDDKFGFTEEEIETLLEDFNIKDCYEDIKEWYNGYCFGNRVIYNPWSIINFLASKGREFLPYWLHTSNNEIVESLLSRGGKELKEELELLVRGEYMEKVIEENIVLNEIDKREDLLWSFLLLGGYLKPTASRMGRETGNLYYSLAIPNLEVKKIYIGIIERYFTSKVGNKKPLIMLDALIKGDVKFFGKILKNIVAEVFSYHDFASEPGKVYHALTAGILVWIMDTHEIKSNRESGYGRYDIMIFPKNPGGIGYVIEFKAVDTEEKETLQGAVKAAIKQIEEKKYETELIERGIRNIKKLAIVFKGKDVLVEESSQL